MATPTLSMAALANSGKVINNKCQKNGSVQNGNEANMKQYLNGDKHGATGTLPAGKSTAAKTINGKSNHAKPTQQLPTDSRARRHVTEEVNEDSIYCIYLKKITYTFNNSLNKQANSSNFVTRCDQVDCSKGSGEKTNSKWYDDQQVSVTHKQFHIPHSHCNPQLAHFTVHLRRCCRSTASGRPTVIVSTFAKQ